MMNVNKMDINGNNTNNMLFEIEDIILNAEVQGKCNMFDNFEASIVKDTISSIESASSFLNDI